LTEIKPALLFNRTQEKKAWDLSLSPLIKEIKENGEMINDYVDTKRDKKSNK